MQAFLCKQVQWRGQVQSIPDTFHSGKELAEWQLWPTVEELRASLHSEMQRAGTLQRPIPISIRDVPKSNSALTALACDIRAAADEPGGADRLRPWQFVSLSCSASTAASAVLPAAVGLASSSVALRSTGATLLLALVRQVRERSHVRES